MTYPHFSRTGAVWFAACLALAGLPAAAQVVVLPEAATLPFGDAPLVLHAAVASAIQPVWNWTVEPEGPDRVVQAGGAHPRPGNGRTGHGAPAQGRDGGVVAETKETKRPPATAMLFD